MPPIEAQIKQTIIDLQKRLREPAMNHSANRAVREGFSEAVNILAEGRTTYEGIDKLRTVQGRAIAILAVDYVLGETSKEVLLGVPVRE